MVSFPNIYEPAAVLIRVDDIAPRLASWERKDHRDQIRLRNYLDDLRSRVGKLPANRPLFLNLRVDVRDANKLVLHHDVENYLTPLFGREWFDHRQFPLVLGSKHVGGGSTLTIGDVNTSSSSLLDNSWCHTATNAGQSPTDKLWKHRLNEHVESLNVKQIPTQQQIEFHMAWRCAVRRNWVWLWKPTGDALSPILGYDGKNKFNPNDDRITSLTLHRFDDNTLCNDVHVGLWWRSKTDDE